MGLFGPVMLITSQIHIIDRSKILEIILGRWRPGTFPIGCSQAMEFTILGSHGLAFHFMWDVSYGRLLKLNWNRYPVYFMLIDGLLQSRTLPIFSVEALECNIMIAKLAGGCIKLEIRILWKIAVLITFFSLKNKITIIKEF